MLFVTLDFPHVLKYNFDDMYFKELIDSLAAQLHITDGIEIDRENRCSLEFDGMCVVIQGVDEVQAVVFCSPLGEPPPDQLFEFYRALLVANFNFQGTLGATLSVNPENGKVFLCRSLSSAALDEATFITALENFINTVEVWCDFVANFRAPVVPVRSQNQTQRRWPGQPPSFPAR